MRRLPKPIVAMVAGYAIGGGHILHLCCDLTIAADNAVFGQTGPRVGSWDGGYGASLLRDLVGTKKAKEFWMLCRQYDAEEALEMGLVNAVVPLAELERETVAWCREMLALSPFALRLVKASFNAHEDGYAGIQQLAHDANLLFYGSRRGGRGPRGVQAETPARLLAVPEARMRIWLMAARPRTLPAAIAPVLVGTAAAVQWAGQLPRWGAFFAALIGSIFIQIGTNLANDYSDAKRGADTADRLGPVRVTASGMVTPQRVMTATWIAFAVAVACGIYLTAVAGPVILVIGVLSIAAGVLYTGGPRPYGYAGFGEVFVFLFFGLVAVNGSYYVQLEELDALPLGLSISVGFLATAIIVVNNVRDVETDRRAGKNTLAVRIGRDSAVQPLPAAGRWAASWSCRSRWSPATRAAAADRLLAAPLAIKPAQTLAERRDGPALNGGPGADRRRCSASSACWSRSGC